MKHLSQSLLWRRFEQTAFRIRIRKQILGTIPSLNSVLTPFILVDVRRNVGGRHMRASSILREEIP
jgi:hypothetical protein